MHAARSPERWNESNLKRALGSYRAVLAELMIPYLGGAVALVSAILLRLVWLVSELVVSGILYLGMIVGGDSRRR